MSALVVLAGGVTALQVSGNAYVSRLGAARTASNRLNLTQAINSLGSTIAPTVGGVLILSAARSTTLDHPHELSAAALHAYRVHQASYIKSPYIAIAATLFLLAWVIAYQKIPRVLERAALQSAQQELPGLWSHRHLMLGVIAMFLYCGAEITIGSFLVNYIRCLVPAFDGAYFSGPQKEALWDRYCTGAPLGQRRYVERYNIVKRA
jgi:FHS family L-fucose permease-like MFS transporter